MQLRPYQIDLINKTRALMQKGHRSILIQSPTGSGKTLLTAHMVGTCVSKKMRAFFIVHRAELLKQSSDAFKLLGIPHGIINPEYPQHFNAPVQIATIQTLARRHKRFSKPNLVIWDETHHIASKSWAKLYAEYPGAYHIGLTATPERLDGQGLGKFYSDMIEGPKVSWLIEHGFLSKYKLYAPSHVNLENVHRMAGDYNRAELGAIMDRPKITGSAIAEYKKHADGKRAMVFGVSIKHSMDIAEEFKKAGYIAVHIDGETPDDERKSDMELFAQGKIHQICSVDLFGEGLDCPGIECIINLRPTESLGLILQQWGRGLRPFPGKDHCVILDHVGACEKFGLPDQDREWSLEGREKTNGDYQVPVKICPSCFGAQKPSPQCIFCGMIFPIEYRTVEQVAGELKEVDAAQLALKLKWKRAQGMAQGFKELVEIGKARGYKKAEAWAAIVLKARQAKRLAHARI